MRDFRDAKAMARRLREALAERGVPLAHSDCLELIARSFGCKDWHVLAALIDRPEPAPAAEPTPPQAAPTWSGPALLLRDIVVFPKQTVPLFIGRGMSVRAQQSAYEGELEVLLVTQKDREDDNPAREGLYALGVIADVLERQLLEDGTVKLLVRARHRARLVTLSTEGGVSRAEAAPAINDGARPADAAQEVAAAIAAFEAYAAASDGKIGEGLRSWAAGITHPGVLADLIAAHVRAPLAAKQALLETLDARQRLAGAVQLLSMPAAKAA